MFWKWLNFDYQLITNLLANSQNSKHPQSKNFYKAFTEPDMSVILSTYYNLFMY